MMKFEVTSRRAVILVETAIIEAETEEEALALSENDEGEIQWELESEEISGLCFHCAKFHEYIIEDMHDA